MEHVTIKELPNKLLSLTPDAGHVVLDRKSDRARNPHDGKCDALLIALYAKRMNL